MIAVAILFTQFTTQAQENSPYSRYGMGNEKPIENIVNRGMGGVAIADDNAVIANPANPASYTSLKLTSFQFGLEGSSVNIKSPTGANRVGNLTLSYVNLGFALSKKIGMSFGLMPLTRSYYQMQEDVTIPSIATANRYYYGGGGLQRIYIGTAYKIKDVSIGINTGYNFGNKKNATEVSFPDSLSILNTFLSNRTAMGGLFYQVGVLYSKKMVDEYTFNVGVSYTGNQKMYAKREYQFGTFDGDAPYTNNTYTIDSIVNEKGKVIIPNNLAAGIMLKNGDFWQIGADYTQANWSKYRLFNQADSMNNSWCIKVGGAITPDANSMNNNLKRFTYRVGFYHGQDIFKFNETAIKKSAGTFGVGIPIRRTNLSIGQINAAMEIGTRGTLNNSLLKENFTRFSIGVTFNDKWFIKRKYD